MTMENREIKFRGLDVKGNWYYGNLAVIPKDIALTHIAKGTYISNKVGLPYAYEVRPETVGQFTGLKDKEGKEIYEGDILQSKTKKGFLFNCETRYGDGKYYLSNEDGVQDDLSQDVIHIYNLKVIGNIYGNV